MRAAFVQLCLSIVAGAAFGLIGGNATLAGMAPPAVTIADRPYDPAGPGSHPAVSGPAAYAGANPEMIRYAHLADDCEGCSDYDLGYRFAAARHVSDSAQCMDFTWSYQRGCLARLRDR